MVQFRPALSLHKGTALLGGLVRVVVIFAAGDGNALVGVHAHGLLGYHEHRNDRLLAEAAMTERKDYKHFTAIPTRWRDNDLYGHINNIEYYGYFDTVINLYLIAAGGLEIHGGSLIGVCAESHCKFSSELAFPETVDAGLRVENLGNSSVRYGIGLFRQGAKEAAAEGWFVHVFVDRTSRRPAPFAPAMRASLEALQVIP
ncbi:MAG TPA: thioesterase family protein [Acidobacteriaceae bacterium]|nr:thioesterase family protein [Acidobacteriaceae bacterium]